jgi:hypothetical protein
VPRAAYQDMIVDVPEAGFRPPNAPVPDTSRVRAATPDDVPAIVALERELVSIERPGDFAHFVANPENIWHVSVRQAPTIPNAWTAFSPRSPTPPAICSGPGVARTEADALA